ncbi:long-chain-fatty-acid--CoA ligase [Paenibacillus baekrokdamisoli]|uniref:Long-chain-fatty-acid--CoA ligase n=1 Tax=Paenibacillus baekrokdamisoli TaxID=1712516 RepID=A0A3G9JEZ6_9BACL|nr:class I adenylate-forming enzyme family protein [Paenibacillus baekrokdamisoli]MBB3068367.1 long-chain acyl-CoA synthetase [Paenibacillus baekrokdamisoli]BBH22588.1 long-chain-fatty-acid--CoA ligase [Paenibacillus baekrokdamisoli]
MLIKDIVLRQRGNNKTAIIFGNETISYDQLLDQASILANRLKPLTTFSNHIAIFLPNSIQYAVSYFAITLCDKVIIPISTLAKKAEIESTLIYCQAELIITNFSNLNILKEMLSGMEQATRIVIVDSDEIILINDKKMLQYNNDDLKYDDESDQIAIMLHTSGTTSNPKRVMLSHRNLISNINSNIESLQLNSDDISLVQLPMFFGYCNTAQFLTHLCLGGTIVILHTMFSPKQFLQLVEKEQITNFTTVPSVLFLLLQHKEKQRFDISSLRYICFGGGIMPVDKLRKLIDEFPSIGFVHTYGQTEAAPRVTCLLPEDALRKIGSVGKALPNVSVKIVNHNGEEVAAEVIGEIIVKGENVMKGYYKQIGETSKVLQDGWLYTGDLAKYDQDQYIYLVGRKKNVIISGGMNIYPEEIEEVLLQYPLIKEAIVIKESHELLGEVPIAKIVIHGDKKDIKNIQHDINKYCHMNLTRFKVPARIIIVENLNKTKTGKIKRF